MVRVWLSLANIGTGMAETKGHSEDVNTSTAGVSCVWDTYLVGRVYLRWDRKSVGIRCL
jgi:hypothetical protein